MKEKLQWFEESLLEVRKVTKVTTGGRRMRFRAIVLVGDRSWHIGLGIGKGNDVAIAVGKATHDAYKNVCDVSITKSWSVPYMVTNKYKACYVTLRPAGPGTWLKAWSSVRTVLELSGFSNILSKIIGSNNPLNNAIATINALTSFKVDVDNIQKVSDVVKEKIVDKDSKGRGDRKPTPRTPAKKPNPTTNTDEVKTPAKKPIQKKEAKSE
jgi:small subunit ribosomal protein S5